jgi:hypothetical protein
MEFGFRLCIGFPAGKILRAQTENITPMKASALKTGKENFHFRDRGAGIEIFLVTWLFNRRLESPLLALIFANLLAFSQVFNQPQRHRGTEAEGEVFTLPLLTFPLCFMVTWLFNRRLESPLLALIFANLLAFSQILSRRQN